MEASEEIVSNRSLPAALEQIERHLIEQALRDCRGNKQKAAQLLGVSRQGLIKKLKLIDDPNDI